MADTVTTKWVYPPNFAGTYDNERNGHLRHVIRLTGISDGTGETNIIKVNRSELQTIKGVIPSKLVIEKINYLVHGMNVLLEWDGVPDETICVIGAGVSVTSTQGCMDFQKQGGLVPDVEGGTGDIKLTSSNCASGDSYDITMTIRLKE